MIGASGWLFKKKSITMHSNTNVNLIVCKILHCQIPTETKRKSLWLLR